MVLVYICVLKSCKIIIEIVLQKYKNIYKISAFTDKILKFIARY